MKTPPIAISLFATTVAFSAAADETVHYTCVGESKPTVTYAADGKSAKLAGHIDYPAGPLPATLAVMAGASGVHFAGGGYSIKGASRDQIELTSHRRVFRCTASAPAK